MERIVRVFDTTLRDGEQTPGVHLKAEQKVTIAKRLEELGVDTIEAGFPASSPGDFDAVVQVARAIVKCEVAALARCASNDIQAAARSLSKAVQPVLHVVLGVSDIHIERKLYISRAEALRRIERSVREARAAVGCVEFSLEDATRAERAFLRQCVGVAVEHGATRINVADTVGCATPWEFERLIADVCAYAGTAIIVSAHCHNDLGMATANTISAVRAGAGQVEVTVNGIGERAGNAALEEVATTLHTKGMAETKIRQTHLTGISGLVADITGIPVQPNRAVVGANAFTHSSGIHQDGVLKDPQNYEFVRPSMVGAAGHRFVLTARSGRAAIAHQARQLGFDLSGDVVEEVFDAFKRLADNKKGAVHETELVGIVKEVCERSVYGHQSVVTA